ncbi:MAG: DUF3180 domain-containing protein [Actinotalea sp.]|nr:DUF3180 domain-containing protein [Actinotalea sp.]
MRRTPWTRLLLVALVTAAVALGVLRVVESRGGTVLPVPLLSVVVIALLAAVVLALGRQVRQVRDGRRRGTDPIVAARTVVLATASAHTGALLVGWYAAHVLLVVGDLAIDARREVAVSAGVAGAGALLLVVAGLVAERWCEVRDRDDDRDGPAGTATEGAV